MPLPAPAPTAHNPHLPTLAELCGASPPEDIDGISIVPELLGARVAGREQEQHEYLYWELGGRVAVRMEDWKAVRPKERAGWELYDLASDISETRDVAEKNPERLARMVAFAEAAHEPVKEGIFHDRADHEKDRRAKWGDTRESNRSPVNEFPVDGLLPRSGWKIVRVSSEASSNGKLAKNAIDGDARTHWHTRYGEELAEHPHEPVIDLGVEHTIRGIRYLCRQDGGWNGAIARFELYVSSTSDELGSPVIQSSFAKKRAAQEAACAEPVRGRYISLRILSEVNGGPWASIAELGVIGD